MENKKLTRRITLLLIVYSLINIFLIAEVLVMRVDMNRKIYELERKIEVLEIHIFPEDYMIPPSETDI